MQSPQKLTPLGISKMLEGDAQDQNMIVQVFDITKTKNNRILCSVSDGQYFTKAYLNSDAGINPGEHQFAIICIKSHGNLKNNIGVTSMKFVNKYPEKLGEPTDWSSFKENAGEVKSHKEFKLEKLMKTEQKKKEMPSAAKTAVGKENQYESIDDLHIGLTRWTILCRITSKVFKESSKKGTKILQIELVDKSKKKIIGTFFHEAAVDFNDFLKQGSIYEISKGRLSEGNYNNSKNEKLSPYTIIFDSKSQFNEVSDVNIIAKSEDSAITLGNVFQRRTFNQEFDVVAYVVEVKEETSFQKDDKNITMKEVVLADPEARITMSANLWRWKQEFGDEMVGKVLIFSRFMLREYKGSISLYSGMRSSIIMNHGHPMKKYENKKVDVSTFEMTTETRQKGGAQQDTSQFCTSTMELNHKINRMREGETVKSILYVWVNRFAFLKKWCYEACPKCKKAAQKYSKCAHCGFAIEQTNLNFSMGVQVSDYCGSIWITAYDQLARKIFHDMGNNAAKQLLDLDKDQMSQKLQNYLYQPFRLKVTTKKDEEGRIRHNAGRLYDIHEDRAAKDNLKKIHFLMGK